jgi:DNA polymerase (family 10)
MTHLYYTGSLRRSKETIGDIDIIAVSKHPGKAMDAFGSMPMAEKVIVRGETKSSIILRGSHLQVDLRIIPSAAYAAALVYFTGSREHNIALRSIAAKKGYKLSEYGLFKGASKKPEHHDSEESLYKKLGFSFIPPELRENRGELEAAKAGKLPVLMEKNDIKGDLHIHSRWSDGQAPIAHMVKAAEKLGYEYIAITDHSPSLKVVRGLSESRLEDQWLEIDELRKDSNVHIFKGAEVDILADGSLDYPDKILRKLDIVIGSVHSNFKMSRDEMTARLIRALQNPHLLILGHPTGRLLNEREGYDADWGKVFKAAADNGKILEINSQPARLDLNDELILAARKSGATFVVNTDSHSVSNLKLMRYGLGQARRGWLEKKHVLNTKSLKSLMSFLEARKAKAPKGKATKPKKRRASRPLAM